MEDKIEERVSEAMEVLKIGETSEEEFEENMMRMIAINRVSNKFLNYYRDCMAHLRNKIDEEKDYLDEYLKHI